MRVALDDQYRWRACPDDLSDLLGRQRWVDRYGDAARMDRSGIGYNVLHPIGQHDRYPRAPGHVVVEQTCRKVEDVVSKAFPRPGPGCRALAHLVGIRGLAAICPGCV